MKPRDVMAIVGLAAASMAEPVTRKKERRKAWSGDKIAELGHRAARGHRFAKKQAERRRRARLWNRQAMAKASRRRNRGQRHGTQRQHR